VHDEFRVADARVSPELLQRSLDGPVDVHERAVDLLDALALARPDRLQHAPIVSGGEAVLESDQDLAWNGVRRRPSSSDFGG
jgi:hypothetical protein